MLVHQSLIAAWGRCPTQVMFDLEGKHREPNSGTIYGSVMHHCLLVMERDGIEEAIKTWDYYWHPIRMEEIAGEGIPPHNWLPGHQYNKLLARGRSTLRAYHDSLKWQEGEVYGLEYQFVVPILGTPHHLAGTIDRLGSRFRNRARFLAIDDNKTGAQKWGLRHNLQGTAYAYATTRPEFWVGFNGAIDGRSYDTRSESFGPDRGEELMRRFIGVPRRFTWINIHEGRFVDGGERIQADYDRFARGVVSVVQSIEAGIFPLRMDGEVCTWCEHRKPCGIADEDVQPNRSYRK